MGTRLLLTNELRGSAQKFCVRLLKVKVELAVLMALPHVWVLTAQHCSPE
jgi:hypothetical protein